MRLSDDIQSRHAAACDAKENGYIDPESQLFVLTSHFLRERGYCCGKGCRHCPYGPTDQRQAKRPDVPAYPYPDHTRHTLRNGLTALSVAPMMRKTDRHFRFFIRCISSHTTLYTEMITTGALLHGERERFLAFDPSEHPVVCQLGGDDPLALVECAKMVEQWGYDAVNLNVGCPSDRVQSGNFGACLMKEPNVVAECAAAMMDAVDIPVTVKHRIGVDDLDSYDDFHRFVDVVSQAGVDHFIVHARKAWLKGLSPKENRTIPPLRYEDVFQLKRAFPDLLIEINGGITAWDDIETHLEQVDAVMIGRAAYDNPMLFAEADARLFGSSDPPKTRTDVLNEMIPYIERELQNGTRLSWISDHMMNLFKGCPGGKRWRQILNDAHNADAGIETVHEARKAVAE